MAQRQWRSDDTDGWKEGFGDGSDGDLTISTDTTESPIDASCSGTSGTTSLSATNASFAAGQIIMIHQTRGTGVGNWELNKISSYSTGTITTKYDLCNAYTDSGDSQAQVRVLKQYSSVTVESGNTYTAKAWDGNVGGIIGWFCSGTTTITGDVSTSGKGHIKGNSPQNDDGYAGEGSAGATVKQRTANGNSGGGGLNDNEGYGGGGGGHGASGSNGGSGAHPDNYGLGGSLDGSADLTDMVLGGSGGGGASTTNQSGTEGNGGNGAGNVVICSNTITISGTIVSSGSNGTSGGGYNSVGGGGGGAGGSVLMKATTATLGSGKITASAGTGGNAGTNGTDGGDGAVGRIHLDYSDSYSGTTSPTLDATKDSSLVISAGAQPIWFM